jgi:hypothetical protein
MTQCQLYDAMVTEEKRGDVSEESQTVSQRLVTLAADRAGTQTVVNCTNGLDRYATLMICSLNDAATTAWFLTTRVCFLAQCASTLVVVA